MNELTFWFMFVMAAGFTGAFVYSIFYWLYKAVFGEKVIINDRSNL